MPTVRLTTFVRAPVAVVFDCARDLELHVRSLAHTGERMVTGPGARLIGMGEQVTWEGRHFGIRQRFTAEITAFDPPHRFQDTMRRGAFRRFVHDHVFEAREGGTRMLDVLDFAAPLPPLGWLVDRLVLRGYLLRLLAGRAAVIAAAAEAIAREPAAAGGQRHDSGGSWPART